MDNKWYIYCAADDGNIDNRQIYVLENESPDPMKGEFVMKGRISTDKIITWLFMLILSSIMANVI